MKMAYIFNMKMAISNFHSVSFFASTCVMVALITFRRTCSFLTLFVAAAALFYSHLGNAEFNPVQLASKAIQCFNNKLIYQGCNKEYQLDESGHLDVPCEATNQYCDGPCESETKSLLKCIDSMASNFLFNNGATTQIIGNIIENGCSNYISQRQTGTFIVGNDYHAPSDSCGLNLSNSPPPNRFKCGAIALILVVCCLLLFQYTM